MVKIHVPGASFPEMVMSTTVLTVLKTQIVHSRMLINYVKAKLVMALYSRLHARRSTYDDECIGDRRQEMSQVRQGEEIW